jgi:hypothetical protein
MDEQQPGKTIQPDSQKSEPTEQAPPDNLAEQDSQPHPAAANQTSPSTGWKFTSAQTDAGPDSSNEAPVEPITWSAESLVAHNKSAMWYAGLVIVTAILAGLVYLLTSDKISTGVIIGVAVIFGVSASHHPKNLTYQLDENGFIVGKKAYNFDSFKAFSVIDESGYSSIYLTPLKRFMPPLIIYASPDIESQVVSVLGDRLPFEQTKNDPIDNLMRRINF